MNDIKAACPSISRAKQDFAEHTLNCSALRLKVRGVLFVMQLRKFNFSQNGMNLMQATEHIINYLYASQCLKRFTSFLTSMYILHSYVLFSSNKTNESFTRPVFTYV